MVPFSFENIARSASFEASNAFPVSDAARATHESFESHLQRAASTTVNSSTRESAQRTESREPSESISDNRPRNEPVRNDTGETRGDEDDVRKTSDAEVTTESEASAERNDEAAEPDTAPADEIVIVTTARELEVAINEVEPEVSDDQSQVVVAKLQAASIDNENPELDASLATNAKESAADEGLKSGEDGAAARAVKRVDGDAVNPTGSETPARRVDPPETNERVAAAEFPEAGPNVETTIPDDGPPQASITQQRHGRRGDISPNQPTHEATDAAPKPVGVIVVEPAADTASDDSSQQRRQQGETDRPLPTANTPAADATTTTATPSRFAQQLLARVEDPNARGLSITNADQARFVDRVARAVQATAEHGGTLRLRLSPPELGSLTLEVKVQGGAISARVETDTSTARSLLLENLPLLRERLAEQGMRVDQFDVDLSDRQAGGTPDGLQQNEQQREERPQAESTAHESDEPHVLSSEQPTKNGNEQLNIIV